MTNQQDIATHIWPPHLEPPQLGEALPWMPLGTLFTPTSLPKPLAHTSLHRGRFYLRSLFQS